MNKPMIPNIMARCRVSVLAVALAALMATGCTTYAGKTQAFTRIDKVETDLKRGVTKKTDVLLLLGEPDGAGALGGFDRLRGPDSAGKKPFDAWYYESVKVSISIGSLETHQDILLVFFDGDTVDGFLWFSNLAKGEMK